MRSVLGIAPLPLVTLLAAGRSPIGLLLLKMTESSLLPLLDVRLEVLLAIFAPLRRATASGASRPAQKQSSTSSPSGQERKNGKGKAPFSSFSGGSGRSGGKGKGARKKST